MGGGGGLDLLARRAVHKGEGRTGCPFHGRNLERLLRLMFGRSSACPKSTNRCSMHTVQECVPKQRAPFTRPRLSTAQSVRVLHQADVLSFGDLALQIGSPGLVFEKPRAAPLLFVEGCWYDRSVSQG